MTSPVANAHTLSPTALNCAAETAVEQRAVPKPLPPSQPLETSLRRRAVKRLHHPLSENRPGEEPEKRKQRLPLPLAQPQPCYPVPYFFFPNHASDQDSLLTEEGIAIRVQQLQVPSFQGDRHGAHVGIRQLLSNPDL